MESNELDPEFLELVAGHTGWPAERLRASTHLVFDVGVCCEDLDDLIDAIESHYHFVATDSEWRAVSSLGDVNALANRLRGQSRPAVVEGIAANAARARRHNRIVAGVFLGWILVGVVAYLLNRWLFVAWAIIGVCLSAVHTGRSILRSIRARRQWKRERRARYGV